MFNFMLKNRGVITVFVTLMMVPIVVITTIFVDVSRAKFLSSQAIMAADSYGEAVLSQYDNLLKELYGLFAVTQNEEGLEALEEFAEYTGYSFNPNGDESDFEGFMPYASADVELSYEPIKKDGSEELYASLANNNVLMTQINDFMRFRVVEEMLEEGGILDLIEQFTNLDANMEAIEAYTELGETNVKGLEKMYDYYVRMENISKYSNFLEEKNKDYSNYVSGLEEINSSDDYKKYWEYKENKAAIDAARAKVSSGASDVTTEDKELADKYVDVDAYLSEVKGEVDALYSKASNTNGSQTMHTDSRKVNFSTIEGQISDMEDSLKMFEDSLAEIDNKVAELKGKLENATDGLEVPIKEEIKGLEEIGKLAGAFRPAYNDISQNINEGNNSLNEQHLTERLDAQDDNRSQLCAGEAEPDSITIAEKELKFQWIDFEQNTDHNKLFNGLKEYYKGKEGEKKDKSLEQEAKVAADKALNDAQNIEDKLPDNVRSIEEPVISQLKLGADNTKELDGFVEYMSGGFDSLKGTVDALLSRFMLATYDFGMFSNRVSGLEPNVKKPVDYVSDSLDNTDTKEENSDIVVDTTKIEDSETKIKEDFEESAEDGEYTDYSLTKVPMSRDVNYLYQSELEYLLCGHNESETNLNETRNIILGIRTTMNFVSTFTIPQLNSQIESIAQAAAAAGAALAATFTFGAGASLEPIIKIAVSVALRTAVAAIETKQDWELLKERASVLLIKMDYDDLSVIRRGEEALITGLFGGLEGGSSSIESDGAGIESASDAKIDEMSSKLDSSGKKKIDIGIELSYENYLYILMFLLVQDNVLLNRTSNLITLNVNQAEQKADKLETLNFKMSETMTAIESTCKTKMDFIILPDNFAKMYISGTDTEVIIENLENQYFGYSVIRGY